MRETRCRTPCSPEAGHVGAIFLLFAAVGGSLTAVLSLGPCCSLCCAGTGVSGTLVVGRIRALIRVQVIFFFLF